MADFALFPNPDGLDGPVNIMHQGKIMGGEKALLVTKREMQRFMGRYGEEMRIWWASLPELERHDFILMYHLVGALLDEYQEEVLDLQNIIREEDIGFGACCFKCRIPNSDTCRLMQCGGCKIAMYCSKDCQKKHYKSHKKHCRKLKIIDKIGSSWYLPGTKSHTDAKLKEAATSLSQGPPLQGPVLPTDAVDEQDGGDIGPVGGEI